MGKTYIDTVKYLVYARIEIGGLVEKPDVVGAIFGQTEGLLGDELDLRELQKNGRIGRIEVELNVKGGKSVGTIQLPSSLDMVETSILGAALETVDRVGPCDATINVDKIEDTRSMKRKIVVNRAKDLLKNLLMNEIPESKEISELVRKEVKIAEIDTYGPEKLPCGPRITTYDSLVIVEGRADILNLLKNDINNCVAVGGANVPKSIVALCREKEVTIFLDGDRGGDIILREISQVADLDFVARAPAGKEVEELTRKELIKALRSSVPIDQIDGRKPKPKVRSEFKSEMRDRDSGRGRFRQREEQYSRPEEPQTEGGAFAPEPQAHPEQPQVQQQLAKADQPFQPQQREQQVLQPTSEQAIQPQAQERSQPPSPPVALPPEPLLKSLNELENTLRARTYDENLQQKAEIPVRDLLKVISDGESPHAIVFDGIVTQRLVDLAEARGIKVIVGVRTGNLFRKPESLLIATKK
ncbi:MAG: DNA primase DnaG [Candidatus Micrarchaeota archaeon]|nr:DNA primase DnaG [Candidatus Micrarchaeota archaeon]